MSMSAAPLRITPELLRRAYAAGVFPMGDSTRREEVLWFDPPARGILPLESFHIPARLAKTLKQGGYEVRLDHDFRAVMEACARPDTWITGPIIEAYVALHREGGAHSLEIWREGRLTGGLYGVSLGAAFFGESMFSRETDASKIALVHLVARLRAGGFHLLDTQFVTDHLARFGAAEIPRAEYQRRLAAALRRKGEFRQFAADSDPSAVLHSATQTS